MTAPTRWVIATENPGKRVEIGAILAECPVELCSAGELGAVVYPEEGLDYTENAIEKARAAAQQLGVIAVGDDSGLEVESLDWGPGPLSARYGGADLDDAGRIRKLLRELGDRPQEQRAARFVCIAALAAPDGLVLHARGECRGRIVEVPSGSAGFGYDPVFQVEGRDQTMAEITREEKNRISHRARAFLELWREWERAKKAGTLLNV